MSDLLKGKIAVVAGASRGCERGIAVALGEQAATVYVTGRSIHGGPLPIDGIPGTIEETAEEVTRRGGVGVPVQVDHTDARQNKLLFDCVQAEHGRLDIFARAVWVAMRASSIPYRSSPSGICLRNFGTISWALGRRHSGSLPARPRG